MRLFKTSLLFLVALVATLGHSQTVRNFPALETDNTFLANNLLPRINGTYVFGTGKYSTIQATVNAACGSGVPAGVEIAPNAVSSEVITSLAGCNLVFIADKRSAVPTYYAYQSGAYAAQGSSGTPPSGPPFFYQDNNGAGGLGTSHLSHKNAGLFPLQNDSPVRFFAQNPIDLVPGLGSDYYLNNRNCYINNASSLAGGGFQGTSCNYDWKLIAGLGLQIGSENAFGSAGWTVATGNASRFIANRPGINMLENATIDCNGVGDCWNHYLYIHAKGGTNGFSDEGQGGLKVNGGAAGYFFQGRPTNGGTGLTNVVFPFTGPGEPSMYPQTGSYLSDLDSTLFSGHIIAYDHLTYTLTTAEAHATSNAFGTTTAAITVPSSNVNGNTITVNVSNVLGTFINGPAIFACTDSEEDTSITVTAPSGGTQNLTASVINGHPSGCEIFQDSGANSASGLLDLLADRDTFTAAGAIAITGLRIVGAKDSTHLTIRIYKGGGQGDLPPKRHNFGTSFGPGVGFSRSSNVAQVCGAGYIYSGQAILISGAGDASFNGTFQAGNLDTSSCMTWSNPGPNASTSGTIATGGSVETSALTGTGSYKLQPAALIKSIGTTAGVPQVSLAAWDGTIQLFPNTMVVAAGNLLYNPNYVPGSTIMIAAEGSNLNPPVEPTPWQNIGYSGAGTSGFFIGFSQRNGSAWSDYLGGGGNGLLKGPTAQSIQGPHLVNHLEDAPLPGGARLRVNSSPMCASGFEDSFIDRAETASNGLDSYQELWDCKRTKWTQTLVSPFTGEGGSITIDPASSFTIATSGAVAFNLNVKGGTANGKMNNSDIATKANGVLILVGTPASSSAACTPPLVMMNSSFIYSCVATNTWVRGAMATW